MIKEWKILDIEYNIIVLITRIISAKSLKLEINIYIFHEK